MRLDRIEVELRPRSPWEAMELGIALVRRHARAIWVPWMLASLPVFALCNAIGWGLDALPWAGLAMWWLKPLFDRLPLWVLSRAVFGQTSTLRETLRAPRAFGWRSLLRDLTWRRISTVRSVSMPVTLLENASGPQLGERRKIIVGSGGAASGLTFLCLNFELVLACSCIAIVFVFVPTEYLTESARAVWALLFEQPPRWALLGLNLVAWAATSFVEPFYVGAGFAFYLNRRTHLEAWDLELMFRRLATRLRAAMPALMLCVCLASASWSPAGRAQEKEAEASETYRELDRALQSASLVEDARFAGAVDEAYRDPLLRPKKQQSVWELKKPDDPKRRDPWSIPWLGEGFGALFEVALWGLLAAALIWLVLRTRHWWPHLWRIDAKALPPEPIVETAQAAPDALPHDVPAAVRRLWTAGRARPALALLYRASVQKMIERAGATLAPGATEAQCLRASQRMPDGDDRGLFAQVVRTWQHAAYAQRLPDDAAFEALLRRASERFGWPA